jgi:hypothetical protein
MVGQAGIRKNGREEYFYVNFDVAVFLVSQYLDTGM